MIALAWLCLVMLNYLFHAAAARGTAFSTADQTADSTGADSTGADSTDAYCTGADSPSADSTGAYFTGANDFMSDNIICANGRLQ